MKKNVSKIVDGISRNRLTNNTQKVLLSLLKPGTKDRWVARTSFRVPSATARVRELRKEEFGSFVVECIPADTLSTQSPKRCVTSSVTSRQTFYRIKPSSVTVTALKKIFKGVM